MFSNKCNREETEFFAVNNVLANGAGLPEECFMGLITKQCVPILTYGCCNWFINNRCKRQINVCFIRTIWRVFKYADYKSVRDVMFEFNKLPMD